MQPEAGRHEVHGLLAAGLVDADALVIADAEADDDAAGLLHEVVNRDASADDLAYGNVDLLCIHQRQKEALLLRPQRVQQLPPCQLPPQPAVQKDSN
jgi:hypothetical protein